MNRFKLPSLGFGLGLRSAHYQDILGVWPKTVDWFEIISENFMECEGKPKRILSEIREHYPIVMHGVGLSIGSTDPLDRHYLKSLKLLADQLSPPWISDHLCWTGIKGENTHDLLPLPYTEEALRHTIKRIMQVQDFLERPLILENPSTYLEFKNSQIPEWEFIRLMAEESDCGLLLDVNNVYVTCYNHRLDPKAYLDAIPKDRVVQIHLAGHCNKGTHIIDTHDDHVVEEVWALYRYACERFGQVSTMVEWDDNIPAFDVVCAELDKARNIGNIISPALPVFAGAEPRISGGTNDALPALFERMHTAILEGIKSDAHPELWIHPKPDFPPQAQLNVYVNGYRYRLFDVVLEDYPALTHALGDEAMDTLLRTFIEYTPSRYFNIGQYVTQLPEFIRQGHMELEHKAFLYELATVEATMGELMDKPVNAPLVASDLMEISPETLLACQLKPRAASKFFAFSYPVNDFLTAFFEEENPAIPAPQETFLVVIHDGERCWRLPLEANEYALLKELEACHPLGVAIERMAAATGIAEETLVGDIQGWFGRWVGQGLLERLEEDQQVVA
ncbi:MAG: hypothetical protein K0R63_1145 [Rickettsiales bacterium]|jgi:uncharacterized protein (UPF0276 family)|nr:hypothetical protein [Rickettsiales bacterium]